MYHATTSVQSPGLTLSRTSSVTAILKSLAHIKKRVESVEGQDLEERISRMESTIQEG